MCLLYFMLGVAFRSAEDVGPVLELESAGWAFIVHSHFGLSMYLATEASVAYEPCLA